MNVIKNLSALPCTAALLASALVGCLLSGSPAVAQTEAPLVAVYPIKAPENRTLAETVRRNDLDLNLLVLGVEETLRASRRFKIFERDKAVLLSTVLEEQRLAACGNDGEVRRAGRPDGAVVEESCKKLFAGNAAKSGDLGNVEFIVHLSLKSIDIKDPVFRPIEELPGRFRRSNQAAIDVSVKVLDTTSGQIKFQGSVVAALNDKPEVVSERTATPVRTVWNGLAGDAGRKIGNAVVGAVYPIEVVQAQGKSIFINRGQGGGLEVGDVFEVYALGEELIDPTTKMSLGGAETLLGEVVIRRITDKFSVAEAVGKLAEPLKPGDILRKK